MPHRFFACVLILALAALGVACGPQRPVLYPNERVQEAGQEIAQQDIDDCLRQAAEHSQGSQGVKEVAAPTAVGAATGAAVGAVAGAITGRPGRGAAVGAATGGTAGLMRGLFRSGDLDPVQKRFVEECLRQKGYQPIGWR